MEEAIVNKLRGIFKSYCKFQDPYNTKSMSLQKWKMFKNDIAAIPELGVPPDEEEPEEPVYYYDSDSEAMEAKDIEFYKHATLGKGEFCLNFKGYIKSLILLVLSKLEEVHPIDFIEQLVEYKDKLDFAVFASFFKILTVRLNILEKWKINHLKTF